MTNTELSVVIVNYKSWKLLDNCITSFNEFPPSIAYEIIVVDNDSQDGEFESFSSQYPNIKFVQNAGNYGFSNGCNLGASHAEGDYLLFLNPDTELTVDNAIDKMVTFLKENQETGIVSCRTVSPKSVERELLFSNPWLLLLGFIRQIYKIANTSMLNKKYPSNSKIWYPEWVTGSVVLIKKQLINTVGRWNQERYWMYHEDPDLCNKVRASGKKIALLRDAIIKHVGGGVTRMNTSTNILTKTEVVISSHNYIQSNAKKYIVLLHIVFGLSTISALISKSCISILFFNFKKSKIYFSITKAILKYYCLALLHGTWKSPRFMKLKSTI